MSGVGSSGSGLAPWRVDKFHPPFPYEFGDGYVVRVACAERKDSAFVISSLGGVAFANKPDLFLFHMDGLPVVADCLRVPLEELRVRAMPLTEPTGPDRLFWGTRIDKHEIESKRRMFCPETLREQAYTRSTWQLRALPFCEKSGRVLTDRCHRCGGAQHFVKAVGIENCDKCLADLRRGTTPAVPHDQLEPLRAALGLVHPDPSRRRESLDMLPPPLAALGSANCYVLLTMLAKLQDPGLPAVERVKDIRSEDRLRRLAAMAHGWSLMTGWPSAVTDLFDSRIATSTIRHGDSGVRATRRFFPSVKNPQPPRPVARLLSDLKLSLSVDAPEGAPFAAQTIRFRDAATLLRCGTNELPDCRRRGLLKIRMGFQKHLPVALYDREEVERLGQVLKTWKSLSRHAWSVQIPPYAIEQIAAVGLLEWERHPFLLDRYDELGATQSNFDLLLHRIEDGAEPFDALGVTLSRTLLAAHGGLRPWGPALALLLDGSVRYSMVEQGLLGSRILIHNEDVERLRQLTFEPSDYPDFRFSKFISLRAAMEVLDLGWNDTVQLLGGSNKGAVPLDRVVELAQAHIGAPEIGRRLGHSDRQGIVTRRWIKSTGIQKISAGTWPRDQMVAALRRASGEGP